MGLRSYFNSLFSSDSVIEKATDAVVKTGDAIFYTEEEKAQAAAERRQWYLELMKALSPSQKSRRGIAWGITFMVSLLSLMAVTCQLAGNDDGATYIMQLLAEVWSMPFVAVVGFYFGAKIIGGK